MIALLAGILAQTCAVMLPATTLEFEWYRDGRPYAQDILIRTRAGERLYQRRYASGETEERVVSCTRSGNTSYLVDRVGSARPVRIPVELAPGSLRRTGSMVVRRVAPPAGAAPNMTWFLVADPGVRLYGMRRSAGITEVRSPRRGGYSVLRGIARNRASRLAADSQFTALAQRVAELETANQRLRDSLRALRSAAPPGEGGRAKPRRPARDTLTADTTAPPGPVDSTSACCSREPERRQ